MVCIQWVNHEDFYIGNTGRTKVIKAESITTGKSRLTFYSYYLYLIENQIILEIWQNIKVRVTGGPKNYEYTLRNTGSDEQYLNEKSSDKL